MPENPGFNLRQVDGRSIIHLRVRPDEADTASEALRLAPALRWQGEDPAAVWVGPDQWLITSDTRPTENLQAHINGALSSRLHAATDMSSAYVCFELTGPASRTVLAMGCGIDLHLQSLKPGHCARTLFAGVPVIMVAKGDNDFDLYLDRNLSGYFQKWLAVAGEDPFTRG